MRSFYNKCDVCGKELKKGDTQVVVGKASGVVKLALRFNFGGMDVDSIKFYCEDHAKVVR